MALKKRKIRASPHRLEITPVGDWFTCSFTSIGLQVDLSFPTWWAQELVNELNDFIQTQSKP